MTYGPIDFIAFEFEGNKFKGEILAALMELVEQKIVRVIDLVIVLKDENGEVMVRELQQLEGDMVTFFDPLQVEVTDMITTTDIDMVADSLNNNSTAAVMLFENLWAIKFKEAVIRAEGQVIMQERIPHEVVLEALEDMAAIAENAAEAESA